MQKDELFAKIGELTVQFATLEHQLQSLLEPTHLTRRLQAMSHDVQHLSYQLRQP